VTGLGDSGLEEVVNSSAIESKTTEHNVMLVAREERVKGGRGHSGQTWSPH